MIDVPQPGRARSFWLQEALAADPGEPCPPLAANVGADVCIVGGGFAGLWTAHELLGRDPSLRIALLESDICGGGASGRNAGFVSSSWFDLPGLVATFGRDGGLRYARLLAAEVPAIGDWCDAHSVDAWFHLDGAVGVEMAEWQRGHFRELADRVRRSGVDKVHPLDADGVRAYADSPRFLGGALIDDVGTIQPARLARALRRVALERGVHVFERTRAVRVDHERPATVRAAGGSVRADHAVLTVGAWGAGWPGFRTSFGNIADYMVATEPIPDRIRDLGWTTHVGLFDARELFYYLRRTEDGRVAIGGGTTGVPFGGRVGRAAERDRRPAEVAARGLLRMFPQLEGVRFSHAWGGPIDMTPTFTPFFRTLEPGTVHAGLGFSGHGLAATRLGARTLASLVLGVRDEWSTLPVVGDRVGFAPPEPIRWPLLKTAVWAMETGDRERDEGRTPNPLKRLLARAPIAYREHLRARRFHA